MIETESLERQLRQPSVEMTDDLFGHVLDKWFSGEKLSLPRRIEYFFGTNEWCDGTFNSHYGCRACFNCYALGSAWKKKYHYWTYYGSKIERRPNWNKKWKRRPDGYTIMYPSVHDTFPSTADDAIAVIRNMLEANITVLFVSKPIYEVVKRILEAFPKGRLEGNKYEGLSSRIVMRFSVSTDSDEEVDFWEHGAPYWRERLLSLKLAYKSGASVGVSQEPFLKPKTNVGDDPIDRIVENAEILLGYVSDTHWFGMMNHLPSPRPGGGRVLRGRELTSYEISKVEELEVLYSERNILRLVEAMRGDPRVRWKESVKKTIVGYIRRHPIRPLE